MKAIVNANTYDFENYYEDRYIIFDSEVMETGDMKGFKGAEEIIDCRECLVMPGLTNCHTHIYSTFSRGMNVPFNPKNFTDILTQLWWKLDGQLDSDAVYQSGLAYGIESIKSGVTSIIDHHASGLCIKDSLELLKMAICNELGLRGIFCFETSDRFDVKECIKENLEFNRYRSEYCGSLFGLHASMSLSDKSLYEISSCIGNAPIHIHVAESKDDVQDCLQRHGKRVIERLDSFDILNRDSVLSHCVHITEDEAGIIGDRDCYVALNPTSNMNNAVGLPDYGMLKRNGIKCMIGNDGLGANITRDFLNLAFGMKNRLGGTTKFSLDDLSQIINNGYEYISSALNIKIGRIKKGYKADLIAVPYNPPCPMNDANALGHLFFGVFDSFHPRDVWASGRQLLSNYKTDFDEEKIFRESRTEAAKVWGRISNIDIKE